MENDIIYEPVEQPQLKPLESWWWEDARSTTPRDDDERRFHDNGEAQRLQDAEEGRY